MIEGLIIGLVIGAVVGFIISMQVMRWAVSDLHTQTRDALRWRNQYEEMNQNLSVFTAELRKENGNLQKSTQRTKV